MESKELKSNDRPLQAKNINVVPEDGFQAMKTSIFLMQEEFLHPMVDSVISTLVRGGALTTRSIASETVTKKIIKEV